ncbi:hypothetical protein ACSXAY_18585 (plasmid) [Clostridium perfringens]
MEKKFDFKSLENALNKKFENNDYLIREKFKKISKEKLVENANNFIKKYKICSEFFEDFKENINYFCVINYSPENKNGEFSLAINNIIDIEKVEGFKNRGSKMKISYLTKNVRITSLLDKIDKNSVIKYPKYLKK